jgi:hypothetical protein
MPTRKAVRLMAVCAFMLFPAVLIAGGKYDGNWTTSLACEAHGETAAYKWTFPSTIKDNVYHAQHGEQGGPGYLVIDGKIADDGSAKLQAKGTVTHNNAHGVFAMKGNNYSYDIKAQFTETTGTGTRNEGAGILGRPCTFEFTKQADAPATTTPPGDAPAASPQTTPPSDPH